ncbi:MAG: hypothetical protein ABI557_03680, partial [Aureliella sp.]
ASRSATVAAQACVLAGCVYITFGLLPVMLGLASRIALPDAAPGGILNRLAAQALSGPMRVVFVVALLSIIVSTATSALLSPASLLARNVFEHFACCNRNQLATDRWCVLASMLVSLTLAFANQEVLALLENALEISLVALLVPFLYAFYWQPRSDRSGVLAIVLGVGVWGAHTLLGAWLLPAEAALGSATWWQCVWLFPSALVGLAASALGCMIGLLTTPLHSTIE